jgi:hypothetical protein
VNALGKLIGMFRAKSFLESLGTCEWRDCKSPGMATPMHSLFKCGCGCGCTMHRSCVISHNLAISRIQQINNHLTRELKAKAC